MKPIVYLHDVHDTTDGLAGANLSNADLLCDIESYLHISPDAVLTADDGYRSVTRLLPLLEQTGARMILFLTTGILDREVYPYEVTVSNMISNLQEVRVFEKVFETGKDAETREIAFASIHKILKPLSHKKRMQWITQLAHDNGVTVKAYEPDVFLNWVEAAELARHPLIEIGAHTHRHIHLPSAGVSEQITEIVTARRHLARHLQKPIRFLAYPYGGQNYRTRLITRLAGYKGAYGTASTGDHPFARPRMPLVDALAGCAI